MEKTPKTEPWDHGDLKSVCESDAVDRPDFVALSVCERNDDPSGATSNIVELRIAYILVTIGWAATSFGLVGCCTTFHDWWRLPVFGPTRPLSSLPHRRHRRLRAEMQGRPRLKGYRTADTIEIIKRVTHWAREFYKQHGR